MTRRDLAHFKVQINKISFANCSEKHSSFYVTFSKLTLLLYRDLLETFTFWGYSDLALHHFAMATLLESSSWVSGHNLVIISNRTQVIKQFIFSHNDFKRKLTKVAHPFYWDQNLKILNMVYSQSIYLIFRTWVTWEQQEYHISKELPRNDTFTFPGNSSSWRGPLSIFRSLMWFCYFYCYPIYVSWLGCVCSVEVGDRSQDTVNNVSWSLS